MKKSGPRLKAEAEELVKGGEVKVENKKTFSRSSTKAVWSFKASGLLAFGLPSAVILCLVTTLLVILPKRTAYSQTRLWS